MLNEDIKGQHDILSRCADGDNKAWESLVKSFSPLVYRVIKQRALLSFISLSESDTDEIFQQTFANIWRKNSLKYISNAKSIPAYLTVIAQNTAVDFIRKNISQKEIRQRLPSDSIYEKSPRDEASNKQLGEIIDDFINRLTLREKSIITLELVHELKHREIAHLTAIPLNTVSTIISRLKESLKKKLKENGYDG